MGHGCWRYICGSWNASPNKTGAWQDHITVLVRTHSFWPRNHSIGGCASRFCLWVSWNFFCRRVCFGTHCHWGLHCGWWSAVAPASGWISEGSEQLGWKSSRADSACCFLQEKWVETCWDQAELINHVNLLKWFVMMYFRNTRHIGPLAGSTARLRILNSQYLIGSTWVDRLDQSSELCSLLSAVSLL